MGQVPKQSGFQKNEGPSPDIGFAGSRTAGDMEYANSVFLKETLQLFDSEVDVKNTSGWEVQKGFAVQAGELHRLLVLRQKLA